MSGYRREPNWYMIDGTYNNLSRSAMLCLAHLARLTERGGWSGSVSFARLRDITGLSDSSVTRSIAELKKVGILKRDHGEHQYEIVSERVPTGGHSTPTGEHRTPTDGHTECPPVSTACPHMGTPMPTGGHDHAHGWALHSYRPKTLTKNHFQEEEAAASNGLRFKSEVEAMVERTGFPTPTGVDLRELQRAIDGIRLGTYPEAIGEPDALGFLEARLRWYWDEQTIRRKHAERRLEEPTLANTLKHDRWRIDPSRPHWKPEPTDEPKALSPERQKAREVLARRNAR